MNSLKIFEKARLKLTVWYVLITMVISILFSILIFAGVNEVITRVSTMQHKRRIFIPPPIFNSLQDFLHRKGVLSLPTPPTLKLHGVNVLDPNLVFEIKMKLLSTLTLINLGILAIATLAGYFLAGRTLQPIKEMMDEQNRFITDASHELKTPLTSLRTELEVAGLDKNLSPEKTKKLIKSSVADVTELQILAENLIKLTQEQKRKVQSKKEKVSLLEVVEAALKKVISLARQKNIVINNQVEDQILEGENQSLTELFIILLDNAVKYSENNKEVKLTSKKTGHQIVIKVIDQGIGIQKKDLSHIFDRFYRADKSRSQTAGFGLGLSIAKEIVESHQGSISVTSTPAKGSIFTVRLPLS